MMPLPWLQGTKFIDKGRVGIQRMRLCDRECLGRLLALWEELETKKAIDA